jgi:poly [ADP-ribose] polymerase
LVADTSIDLRSCVANVNAADVKELIRGCGGAFATKISDDVTHLVATPAQFSKNGAKVKEATNYPSIKIVDFEWLNKSLASKSKISVDGYLLDPAQEDAGNGSDTLVAASITSRKRQRADDQDEDDIDLFAPTDLKKSKVMQKDGQKAKSRSVNIPVDEHCPSKSKYKVYIDDDGMIFDATLNQTNSGNNNNKFYRLQLLSDDRAYYTWTRWGRVGNPGQSKMLGDGSLASALMSFHDKFKGMWDSSTQVHSWSYFQSRRVPGLRMPDLY